MRGPGVRSNLCWLELLTFSLFSLQEAWEDLLASSKFNKHETFAVVFQPFFDEIEPPLVSKLCAASRLWSADGEEVWTTHLPLPPPPLPPPTLPPSPPPLPSPLPPPKSQSTISETIPQQSLTLYHAIPSQDRMAP